MNLQKAMIFVLIKYDAGQFYFISFLPSFILVVDPGLRVSMAKLQLALEAFDSCFPIQDYSQLLS